MLRNVLLILTALILVHSSVSRATEVGIPTPRPINHEGYYYFYTQAEKHAPIYSHDGTIVGSLPGDSLIRTVLSPDELSSDTQFITFESVPKTTKETIIRGKIPIVYLGREITDVPTPIDLETIRNAEVVIGEIKLEQARKEEIEKRKKFEQVMTVDDAIAEFHATTCGEGRTSSESVLKAKWERYRNSRMLTDAGKQVALGASALDLVARTILYETQREEALKGYHPGATACQWDIIALSIVNRAYYPNEKVRKGFGARYVGDVVGAATDPQYNVWMESKVAKNPDLIACHLSPTYKKEKVRNIFKGITLQIRETLGIQKNGVTSPPRLSSRFKVIGSEQPQLQEYTHYFHPGGMNKCNVNRNSSPLVTSGYIRVIKVNKKTKLYDLEMFPVVKGVVIGAGIKNIRVVKKDSPHEGLGYPLDLRHGDEWDFDLFVQENKKWVQKRADEFFDGDAAIVGSYKYKDGAPDPFHRACLPDGVQPRCFSQSESDVQTLGARGIEVPITWYKKDLLAEIIGGLGDLGFTHPQYNVNIPKGKGNSNGRPIQIQCIAQNLNIENQFPSFGGPCDKNIQLASEVSFK